MSVTNLRFYIYIYIKNITIEGTVSQNFDIGLGLFSMKSRKYIQKSK